MIDPNSVDDIAYFYIHLIDNFDKVGKDLEEEPYIKMISEIINKTPFVEAKLMYFALLQMKNINFLYKMHPFIKDAVVAVATSADPKVSKYMHTKDKEILLKEPENFPFFCKVQEINIKS